MAAGQVDAVSQISAVDLLPYGPRSRPDHWVSYAIVDQQWKLLANQALDHVELYDITADIYEKDDLKAQHPEVVTQLLLQLEAWQQTLPSQPTGEVFSATRKK